MSKIKAVIFDFDGTVLDTEKYYMQFWIKAVAFYGYKMTKTQYYQVRSLRKKHLANLLYKWYGKAVDYKDMEAKMFAYRDQVFNKMTPKAKKGIRQALIWLKKNGYIVAMATAGAKPFVFKQLKDAKLFNYFDTFISSSEVKNGKPSPDIYIYACKKLGLKPSECIAVEDCENGALSAIRAKLNTVLIPDLNKPDKKFLKHNVKVVKDGYELIKLIKNKK